jgi:hypothetical protein
MRIAFISYSDLLWPPGADAPRLSTDRFVFVYANTRGEFDHTLESQTQAAALPPYVRNQVADTAGPGVFRAFRDAWGAYFNGDGMLYDYHLFSHRQVWMQEQLARVVHRDVQLLQSLGFNGLISCQPQRAFFPTGLPMYTMGQMLWMSDQEFESLAGDYYYAAFGADGARCGEAVKVIGERLAEAMDAQRPREQSLHALARLEVLLAELTRLVERNTSLPDPCQGRSWRIMGRYVQCVRALAAVVQAMLQTPGDAPRLWQEARRIFEAVERDEHAIFDVWTLLHAMDPKWLHRVPANRP